MSRSDGSPPDRHPAPRDAASAALALVLSADVMTLSLTGIRRRYPGVSNTDAGIAFIGIHYGPELAEAIRARLKKGAPS